MLRHPVAASPLPRSSRGLAAFLALMVWLLGVLAASPQLHAELHDDSGEHSHECAVTLFAHGADTLGAAPVLHRIADARELGRVPVLRTHAWSAPHYLHRPACGPPSC